MIKVAVVTVNYNTDKDTNNLLKSLSKIVTKNIQLNIIVVDNGSKIPFQLNPTEKKEDIHLIRSEKNTGFAGGFNLGIQKALHQSADYVLIINNDTQVYPDMLNNLLQAIESNPQIGVAVPKIYFAKGHEFHKSRYQANELGKVIWYAGGFTDWDNVRSIHRGMDEVDSGQYDKAEPTEFATGCCMLFKREVLEKIGFFNEKYFLYYEDADLSERIKKAGYQIYYVPTAYLYHMNASSSGGPGNNLHDYFLTRNQMLFGFSYAPLKSKIALVRQSIRLFLKGRQYQKLAIKDFYSGKFGEGTFFEMSLRGRSADEAIFK